MEDAVVYTILCASILILVLNFLVQTRRKQFKNLPPSPPAIPFLGHLHLLENKKQPLIYRNLHNLGQKYGPVMSLKLGSRFAVLVTSKEAVEECFTKNDVILANRPEFVHGKYLNYNFTTMVNANYSDHWRNLRRIANTEIFAPKRLDTFADLRAKEVRNLAKRISRVTGDAFGKVDLRAMILDLTFNLMMTMLAGKRYFGEDVNELEEALQFRDMMNESAEFAMVKHAGDFLPILKNIDYNGLLKSMKHLSHNMDMFLDRLLDEHRADKDRNTMINHLLALQEKQPELYTDLTIKGLVLTLAITGTRTAATSLEWAICLLLNNRDALKKAKEELDTQLGHDRLIEEPDITNLHYLQGIVYENYRLYPVSPLLVPRQASDYCTIGGYDVPPGTMVIANVWSIQRNSEVWDDPLSFKPERHLSGKPEAFTVMPFGMGRRACPGEGLAYRTIAMTLGTLIQCFEWDTVRGKEISMDEVPGAHMSRAEPLEIMFKPRPDLDRLLS